DVAARHRGAGVVQRVPLGAVAGAVDRGVAAADQRDVGPVPGGAGDVLVGLADLDAGGAERDDGDELRDAAGLADVLADRRVPRAAVDQVRRPVDAAAERDERAALAAPAGEQLLAAHGGAAQVLVDAEEVQRLRARGQDALDGYDLELVGDG